jgi:hypothetical protein
MTRNKINVEFTVAVLIQRLITRECNDGVFALTPAKPGDIGNAPMAR